MCKFKIGIVFLFVFGTATATNFHVCDCSIGADTDCIAGNDSNNGTFQAPWQSYEKARTTFSTMAAGDSINFCDGGYWRINGAGKRWTNSNCRADNFCIVSNYISNWASGDESQATLERLDNNDMFAFEDGGNANHEEGYYFENLQVKGSGLGRGFLLYNDIDDVVINNVTVSNFKVGVQAAGSQACDINDSQCDGLNQRITLSNSTIINNLEQGWLGSSSGGRVLNNYFEHNGNRAVFDHNIYISSHNHLDDMRVIGNQLYQAALDSNGVCQGASLVVHGDVNNLLIENNTIWEDAGFSSAGCWGIAVDSGGYPDTNEIFSNVVIRGNTIRNVGNLGIGVSLCVDCIIENNIVIQDQLTFMNAIIAPNKIPVTGETILDKLTVRNNSIYFANGALGTAIKISDQGDNHSIVSNAIYYTGNSSQFNCLKTTNLPPAAFDVIDNNICYHPNASTVDWVDGSGSLANWQIQSGFDINSLESNPGFKDRVNYDLSPIDISSNMINAGHVNLSSALDIQGINRDLMPDIGAYEWSMNDLIFSNGFD